jgi:hypothetical protein
MMIILALMLDAGFDVDDSTTSTTNIYVLQHIITCVTYIDVVNFSSDKISLANTTIPDSHGVSPFFRLEFGKTH